MNELVFSRRFVYNGFNGTHEAIVTLDDHNFTDPYPDPDSQKLSVCDWSTIEALTETLPCSGAPLADGHRDQYMPGTYFENGTLLQCDVLNTSYSMDFSFINGHQEIRVSRNTTGTSPPVGSISKMYTGSNDACLELDGLAQLCVFDAAAIRLLSYQAMVSAFHEHFSGYVRMQGDSQEHEFQYVQRSLDFNTSVMGTVLADTKEIIFLRQSVALTPQGQESFGDTLKNHLNQLSLATELPFASFAKSYNRSTGVSLQDALEELFQNFTISLLSEPYLHSPYAPEPSALVTFSTFHNVYTYSYRTLWIAYGLAIVFATLSVLGGAIALLLNGASYSTTFSTIVRVGRTVQLSEEVSAADGEGFEPLPKHLAKAKVRFPHTRSGSAAPSSEASREREKEPSVNVKSQLLSPEEAERRDARTDADSAEH
nr:hypothetical protein B0A51_01448 [Rachicladosporium sp. CCFEE 5018]